ncbi:helix-turn-helix domain-containing protein [Erythrobacter sp.]|uniref:helix-turn-helix domain-containing protein n=1 Tax=Erythrobacter sp. TaxID=1042 RepID=UPI001425C3EB|nr:helix-turn-helix domain-containing protein [Erythrobacter sp.]QIQ86974.1 MAG: helix-turn-helix domain-containing protein [Erythrobacter sp.]
MSSDTQTGGFGDETLADAPEEDLGGEPVGAGATLRAARERKRLELAHIAAETRIPMHHLEVIEAGDFETLPSRTYAIGFARNYARVVGLDEEEIADKVRAELSDEGERRHHGAGAMEPGDPAKLPSNGLAWFGAIAAIVLVIGVVALSSSYFGQGADLPPLTREDTAPAAPTEPAPQVAAADTDAAPAPAPDASGEVVFTATEDGVWVRFYERGGERLYEAQMESGESFTVPGDAREPLINTGRPDAFAITIGGRRVPPLAEGPQTMGGEPVSARALLARGEADGPSAN